jgi:hypothetical protein
LEPGRQTFTFPRRFYADRFALQGTWTVGKEAIVAGAHAEIAMGFTATKSYLDVGGTGTIVARVGHTTTRIPISGAPDIHTVVNLTRLARGLVLVKLSPGLRAYSFTFG